MNPQIMKYDKKKPFLAILTIKSDFEGKACEVTKLALPNHKHPDIYNHGKKKP